MQCMSLRDCSMEAEGFAGHNASSPLHARCFALTDLGMQGAQAAGARGAVSEDAHAAR